MLLQGSPQIPRVMDQSPLLCVRCPLVHTTALFLHTRLVPYLEVPADTHDIYISCCPTQQLPHSCDLTGWPQAYGISWAQGGGALVLHDKDSFCCGYVAS